MKRLSGVRSIVLGIFLLAGLPRLATAACGGDCDGGGDVTINEIITGVTIALGTTSVGQCENFDLNHDGEVTIDEVISAVNNVLVGCPPPGSPTVQATPTATATPMAAGPIDPEMLGIWSGPARNESNGAMKQVRISVELQGNNVVVTDLGGNLYKTSTNPVTMSAPTRTTIVYNVLGNPVIVYNLTLVNHTLAGIYSATTPTFPPSIEAFGLALAKEGVVNPDPRLTGTWSGTGNASPGGMIQLRLKLEIQGGNVLVTDLNNNLLNRIPPGAVTAVLMHLEGGPTFLSYVCDAAPCGPSTAVVTLNLSLLASGRLVGSLHADAIGNSFQVGINLGKE